VGKSGRGGAVVVGKGIGGQELGDTLVGG